MDTDRNLSAIDPSLTDQIADYRWAVLGSWWSVFSVIL